ncbi:MAG: hypothetical protein Q9187_000918 [Circinaria calcarea]
MAEIYNSQVDAFTLYHKIHEETHSVLGGPTLPAVGHAVAGSTGAAISNIFTYPLDLIVTRLQIQRQLSKDTASPHSDGYKSIRDTAEKIYAQEGGVLGLYTGVLHSTSKTIADSFLFFLAYNFLRQSRLRSQSGSSKHLPVLDELSIGFFAGAFAKLLTTPLANIVTRKQTSSMLSVHTPNISTKPATTRSIAKDIYSEKGLQGFWSGYSASLVLTLNPSLTFFFYETLKRVLLSRNQQSNPAPQATFLLAAMSKAIASSITYPFSLAKARAQASSDSVDTNDTEIKESLDKASDGKIGGTKSGRRAVRSTVFSTILYIARNEGISALYEGLSGEVLKGFFGHGLTMIIKEAVHKLIIQLYYTILKLLKRYPSPPQLVDMTKAQTQASIDKVKDGAEALSNKGQSLAREASTQSSTVYESMKAAMESTRTSLEPTVTATKETVAKTTDKAYDGAQAVASKVLENASATADSAAAHAGRNIESLGRAIQPKNEGSGGKDDA